MAIFGLDMDGLADSAAEQRSPRSDLDRILRAKYVGGERVVTDGGFTYIGGERVVRDGGATYVGQDRVRVEGGRTYIGDRLVTREGGFLFVDGKPVQE